MNKTILFIVIVLIVALCLINGCSNSDIESFVKTIPQIQEVLSENPNANIVITYWSEEEIKSSITEINTMCQKQVTPTDMYKAIVKEDEIKITSWIKADDRQVLCIVRQVGEEKPTEPEINETIKENESIGVNESINESKLMVSTNNVAYNLNETINITVINNLFSAIYYGGCSGKAHKYIYIEKKENSDWEEYLDQNQVFACTATIESPPREFKSGEMLSFLWYPAPTGLYRVRFDYLVEAVNDWQPEYFGWQSVYSNEFEIR